MKVLDVLKRKGAQVQTIAADTPVHEAVARLAKLGIGSLVVLDHSGNMTGLVGERDIILGCAKYGADVVALPVSEIMNPNPATAAQENDLDDLMELMTTSRVRHIPILADGVLCGLVSIGDVVKAQLETLEYENHHMRSYVYGYRD